ncbi:AAA family ATPase [Dietzia sp.]|uniref:AAA family ATPase n=1 Tax=Dietzia sp. TaxID=1871616 RepID=UPI002FDB70C2
MTQSDYQIAPGVWASQAADEEPPAPVVPLHSEDGPPRRRLTYVPASSVRTERIEWLMEAWIPRRSITLLAGREGHGKSTLAVDIVARATRGELDNGYALRTLCLVTEDSRSMTVKPRLVAAGADLDMVGFLDVSLGELGGTLRLPDDYDMLADLIRAEGIGLVVLDAAKSAMSSVLNDHRDDDVRRFLEPAAAIADELDVAFLALVHFGKRTSNDSGALILGSIAWSQVARSVLSVAKDEETGALVVSNTKGNLADRELCRECSVVSAEIPLSSGGTTTVGRIDWHGESSRSARDLLEAVDDEADATERTAAEEWLDDYLRLNPGTLSATVKADARKVGHAERTLKRAAKALGVVSRSEGFPRRTVWDLPGSVPTVPTGPTVPNANIGGPNGLTGSYLGKQNVPTLEPVEPVGPVGPVGPPLRARAPLSSPLESARSAVLGALHPEHALDARTVAGGVPAEHRPHVPAALDALVADGSAVLDSRSRYLAAATCPEGIHP